MFGKILNVEDEPTNMMLTTCILKKKTVMRLWGLSRERGV
jgi:hypothetical protein